MIPIETHKHWWLGENRQHYTGREVLIKLSYPRVAIFYDVGDSYFVSYDQWISTIAEIQWIDGEKPSSKEQEKILTEGWNFLAIEERILEEDMEKIEEDDDEW